MKRYAITTNGKAKLWPADLPPEMIRGGISGMKDITDIVYARNAQEARRLNRLAELEMTLEDVRERTHIIRKAK